MLVINTITLNLARCRAEVLQSTMSISRSIDLSISTSRRSGQGVGLRIKVLWNFGTRVGARVYGVKVQSSGFRVQGWGDIALNPKA
jgi:hypothetical protein